MKKLFLFLALVLPAFGAQQVINTGTTGNDGTGDTVRAAFGKANSNFTELYTAAATFQPHSAGLDTFSALSTAGFGLGLLNQASASAARTTLGLGSLATLNSLPWSSVTGTPTTLSGYGITNGQPLNSDLTALSGIGVQTFGASLLTQSSAASARTSLVAAQQVTYVADGDSRTFGSGSPAVSWLDLLSLGFPGVIEENYGVSGKTVAQMVSGYAASGSASSTVSGGHQWSPAVTGRKGVYFVWGATNDLGGGASAITILANLQSLYASARTDGYSKVVGFTETPRAPAPGAGWETTDETQRTALNASLRGLTLGLSNTPDVLIDTEALFPRYSSFGDGIHISAAQQAILANYVRQKLAGTATTYMPFVSLASAGAQTYHSGGAVQMTGFNVIQDTQALYDSTNHNILCPTTGTVEVSLNFLKAIAAAGDVWVMYVYDTPSGGSAAEKSRLVWHNDPSASYETINAITHIQVTAGDLLDFRIDASGGTNTWTILSNGGFSNFTIRYLPAQ